MSDRDPAPPPERAPVVLVVDDETDVRDLVVEILRSAGIAALSAADGDAALAVLAQPGADVDLVLTDVMMPVLDGPTLARRLARERPGLPVLFMTGYPSDTLAALGMLPAEAARIEKPFRIRELLAKVREAMKKG